MSNKVRLGIVGTSGWAEMLYFGMLRNCPDADVVAVCGRNDDRLTEVTERYSIPNCHRDYRELLARTDLDAVAIVVPDDLHSDIALAAVERGLHVLCEKPLANSAGDARKMLDAANAAGITHMVMFTWRWQPHFQYIRGLVEQGAFGRIYRTQLSFTTSFAHQDKYQWRLDPTRANGVIGDLGSHLFDLSRWLFGEEIASISADLGTAVSRDAIAGHSVVSGNDFAHATFRYAGGAQGTADVTVVSHDGDRVVQHVLRIEGEKASLELEHVLFGAAPGVRMRMFERSGNSAAEDVPDEFYRGADRNDPLSIYKSGTAGVRRFVSDVRYGRMAQPDFVDGWQAQRLVDAALMSSRERRWVNIS
jgi:predicted dehydrogenase